MVDRVARRHAPMDAQGPLLNGALDDWWNSTQLSAPSQGT
jgi:hypothetical protein